jgi:hypothetical protein
MTPADAGRVVVVDGERFVLAIENDTFHLDWGSGPNLGYGFGGRIGGLDPSVDQETALRAIMSDEWIAATIREFLSDIDPEIGYLRD